MTTANRIVCEYCGTVSEDAEVCRFCRTPRKFTCARCGRSTRDVVARRSAFCPVCRDWTGALSGDEFLLDLLTRRLREMQTAVVPESVMREEGVAVGVELRCGDRYRITVERIKDG